ncbi:MAG: rhamnulose-1-phosphate aldolase [Planctomycetota bacterium]|jgi:rhamnulose-1-phosphate aldolase|nr:rhamnulose-1-phosphate aldolase [Planctomycetota bacterium]
MELSDETPPAKPPTKPAAVPPIASVTPYSDQFHQLLFQLGQVGNKLREIGAVYGKAGNISVSLTEKHIKGLDFDEGEDWFQMPVDYPKLGRRAFLVTAAGSRLWYLDQDPENNLCVVWIKEGGQEYRVVWGAERGLKPTSEFNSHLRIFEILKELNRPTKVVMHAQPLHLTMMSHCEELQDKKAFNSALLRWQPETIITMPNGVGFVPYRLPGSQHQEASTGKAFMEHDFVVWAKHGAICTGQDPFDAFDKIDYLEMSARYYLLSRQIGFKADGISDEQMLEIAKTHADGSKLLEGWIGDHGE